MILRKINFYCFARVNYFAGFGSFSRSLFSRYKAVRVTLNTTSFANLTFD